MGKTKTSWEKQNTSRRNQTPQEKTKYLTAKPKTSGQKQNTPRQNQKSHGKTKDLTAKPNTSQQKQNTSRQKQIHHGESKYVTVKANTLRQRQIPHGKSKNPRNCKDFKAKAKTHDKPKTSRQKQVHVLYRSLEEGSLEPKVLAKDVGPGCKSSMAAFDE